MFLFVIQENCFLRNQKDPTSTRDPDVTTFMTSAMKITVWLQKVMDRWTNGMLA
jgi:hypothetical protein